VLNFGPCTITRNGVDLGKTQGGVSLRLHLATRTPVQDDYDKEDIILGGEGELNLYQLSSSLTLTNSMLLYDYEEVILTNVNFVCTIKKCKIYLSEAMEIGTFKQQPVKCKLVFTADAAGDVLEIT
jgi:hypothetical protein